MIDLPYYGLLAVHILAVAIFLAGSLVEALSLPSLSKEGTLEPRRAAELQRLRFGNAVVTTPALFFIWILGLAMTLQVGWFATGWMKAKIACVAMLTLIHGSNMVRLQRLSRGRSVSPSTFRPLLAMLLLVLAISTLVLAKPF
ncbi:CopD family protein [Sphingomonas oleivorans]|nr:CopD family protein [Sphingomonas oleivorans]